MREKVVEVKNLSKIFKQYKKKPGLLGSLKSLFKREYISIDAVKSVSFDIEEGEFVGFIGPNGAGKTTTLKCLSGLLFPSSGTINVLGFTPFDRKTEFLKQISLVMGQKNQLWWDLPAMDSFLLNQEIYDISKKNFNHTLDGLIEMLDLRDILNIQVRKLSLGQRMKCELVAALLHSPKILFLDEPTIGLDFAMQKRLREFLRGYNSKYKTTIILTSHNMDDVQELCARVIMINKGELAYDGSLDGIVKKYVREKYISLQFLSSVSQTDLEKFGEVIEYDGVSATISVDRKDVPLVSSSILKSLPIDDVDIKEMSLEDVVINIFDKQ
ncbi:ABC transporter ATP-binding protein [Candidatus Dojkabacteria bacterium]|nr:ABC transporter ATP-binding protein [Candidatus Dojkabacteria bacterium]